MITAIIKKYLVIGLFFTFLFSSAQQTIALYPDRIPNSLKNEGIKDSTVVLGRGKLKWSMDVRIIHPDLTLYLPEKSKATGIGVIICPGGGYGVLAIDSEGHDIARKLCENGIAGIVLRYRMPNSLYVQNKEIVPLQDAQRAVQLVRENAQKWGINPYKLGILGSSAGGHLASTLGTHYQKALIDNPGTVSLRPDFMILNYPGISMEDQYTHMKSRYNLIGTGLTPDQLTQILKDNKTADQKLAQVAVDLQKIKEFSNELHVTADTPPTFITHSVNDRVVKIQNSLLFISALQQNRVPVESFFYAKGGHGYGMDNGTAQVDWIDPCIDWIKRINNK